MAQVKDEKSKTTTNAMQPEGKTEVAAKDDFEFLAEIPASGGGGGKSKYDWGAWPAPKEGQFPSKVYTDVKAPKTLYTSINKYKKKLEEAGKPAPEFTVRKEQNAAGETVGFRVIRTQ